MPHCQLYSSEHLVDNASIHLHARKLEFTHPVKKEPVTIIAPPPKDPVWEACLKLNTEI